MSIYVRDEHGVLQALKIPAYKGEKGEAGVTPNLQVGDVVTLEAGQQATIVRRGDDENPIFDFSIPKGDDGKDGIYVGKVDDAPSHAQVVVNDDPTPYDLFFENANVDYMGNTYTSLKEKADADIEYLLRKFGTQHYEGTNITATDTYMKRVNSAMFKGQTLVNLQSMTSIAYQNSNDGIIVKENDRIICTSKSTISTNIRFNYVADASKTYTIKCRVFNNSSSDIKFTDHTVNVGNPLVTVSSGEMTTINFKFKPHSTSTNMGVFLFINHAQGRVVDEEVVIEDLVILEGDYTKQDIPYFEGMQSTKSPVLTSANGFLWDKRTDNVGMEMNSDGELVQKATANTTDYIKLPTSKQIYFNVKSSIQPQIARYDENKKHIQSTWDWITGASKLQKFEDNVVYIRARYFVSQVDIFSIGVFDNSKFPQPQPISSTLTTPQGLILRGVGDVHDTLDLNTGEHTVWTTEKVLNGEEKWTIAGGWSEGKTIAFALDYSHRSGVQFTCDKFNVVTKDLHITDSEGFMPLSGLKIAIRIDKAKASTLDEFKRWLSQNNTTIIHKIGDNPVKKTVDLKGQKVYSYDGTTHYTTKSLDGHPAPILSIDVPTNTTTMIARQREEIQTLSVENEALKEEVVVANQQRKDGDVELLGYNFDLDFRLMEIECSLDLPISLRTKGVKDVNTYKTAKTLILAGNYERADMEHKLAVYLKRGRLTQEEYDELIALMDAREMVE